MASFDPLRPRFTPETCDPLPLSCAAPMASSEVDGAVNEYSQNTTWNEFEFESVSVMVVAPEVLESAYAQFTEPQSPLLIWHPVGTVQVPPPLTPVTKEGVPEALPAVITSKWLLPVAATFMLQVVDPAQFWTPTCCTRVNVLDPPAGVTVKLTPLLATPPTVTTTFPVVAPVGTDVTRLEALQLVTVAAVPLKVTVLLPCVEPKFVPVIVTGVPTGPMLSRGW